MTIFGGTPLVYERRTPEKTKIYDIVRRFVNTFFAEREQENREVPKYIRREFENFLKCGILAHGFVRVHCEACGLDFATAFSCKGRGICQSCTARRMAETAIHLDDNVIPYVPVRQFVLTLPVPVRLWAARSRELLGKVCTIASEVIQLFLEEKAGFDPKGKSKNKIQGGLVVFVQRFGSALNLNIHAHILALDGVFEEKTTGEMKFHVAKSPTDEDVSALVGKIAKRINKHLVKRNYLEEVEGEFVVQDATNLFEQDNLHLPSQAASLTSRIAFGENEGKKVKRIFANGRQWFDEEDVENKGERCAARGGYSLHANTCIKKHDRERLVKLIRYMSRPAVSDDRIDVIDDEHVRVKLKSAWKDGTTHIEMSGLEFLEKLMALIPLPKFHLTRYFGILSSKAKNRSKIIPPLKETEGEEQKPSRLTKDGCRKKRYIDWADLLARTFSIDILLCGRCGGRMIVNAVVK